MNTTAPIALKVLVQSFSYKKGGVPVSTSEHGGGFVFDCRCLPNPGRLPEFKEQTGRDGSVVQYLEAHKEAVRYLGLVTALVDQAIENYITRGFEELSVSFGCTGGQHRSVYFAERIARHVKAKFSVQVTVVHRDIPGGTAA